VEGIGEEILRRYAARTGHLAGLAGAAGLGASARLGGAGHRHGDFPARHRPAAAACAQLARFWKGIGMVLLLVGASLVVGAVGGSRDPLQPLGFLRSAATPGEHVAFERVKTLAELEARLAAADRPVMLDFYADWCVSCKEMEKYTFTDARVAAKMRRMTLLQVDVTANSDEDKALLKRFGLFGPPGIIFFDTAGKEIAGSRVVGYQPADSFLKVLEAVGR
jgi:thiol:disulfide interchange protein DsbD